MPRPLSEQSVVIAGASSGIGRATALRFARGGAAVTCAARSEEALDSLVEEVQAAGGPQRPPAHAGTATQQLADGMTGARLRIVMRRAASGTQGCAQAAAGHVICAVSVSAVRVPGIHE